MNTNTHLEKLVACYVDGTCGGKELMELETLLLEDAGNRKYFIDIVLLAEDLGMLESSRQSRISIGFPPLEILTQRHRLRSVKTALLAAAAVILVSAVAILNQMVPQNDSILACFSDATESTQLLTDVVGRRGEFTVAGR